jgi:hypothetical protein
MRKRKAPDGALLTFFGRKTLFRGDFNRLIPASVVIDGSADA